MPTLPEDYSQWPSNPYQLLGVAPGVSQRELRRAYADLIRTYKPEQYPEQFRLIRAAYQFLLSQLELACESPAGPEADSGEDPPPSPLRPEKGGYRPPLGPDQEHGTSDLSAQIRRAWALASAGQERDAYAQLVQLHTAHPEDSELMLRLYWLLTLAPEVEPGRRPVDWLLLGLQRTGPVEGPLHQLLQRELADSSDPAVSDACTSWLLSTPPSHAALALLKARWRAAEPERRREVVTWDMQHLQQPYLAANEELWARLHFQAIEQLAWLPEVPEVARWTQEVTQATHLQEALAEEFDWLEHLLALIEAWRRLPGIPFPEEPLLHLLLLLHDSWSQSPLELCATLEIVLAQVALEPQVFLRFFETLHRSPCQVVLLHYGKILLAHVQALQKPYPEEQCRPAALSRAVEGLALLRGYEQEHLLQLCLTEAISPEALAQLLTEGNQESLAHLDGLGERLLADWPLRYVFLSCWLSWQ